MAVPFSRAAREPLAAYSGGHGRCKMTLNENPGDLTNTPFQGSGYFVSPQCVALGWLVLPFQGVDPSSLR